MIFNGIDYGEWFDVAAASLAVSLGIPYNQASSYGLGWSFDSFAAVRPGNGGSEPCYLCDKNPGGPGDVQRGTLWPDGRPVEVNRTDMLQKVAWRGVACPSPFCGGGGVAPRKVTPCGSCKPPAFVFRCSV